MSRRSNRLVLSDSQHGLQILQQLRTMLMSRFVAYNMALATLTIQGNSKWCHCYLVYTRRLLFVLV